MKHRGEIVESAVRESGYSITKLAKRLGKSRRWMYHAFENRDLSLESILTIGSIIHYDFSDAIDGLSRYKNAGLNLEHKPSTLERKDEVELWKDKYLDLLEKHNNLLLEIAKKDLLKGSASLRRLSATNKRKTNLKPKNKSRRNKK